MITIDDYNAAHAARCRRVSRWMLGGMAAGMAYALTCMVLIAMCGPAVGDFTLRHLGPGASDILAVLAMPLPVLLLAIGCFWLPERRSRTHPDPRLSCPACGRRLGGSRFRVVATGRCQHCGARALAEPVAADRDRAGYRVTRDEFRAALAALERRNCSMIVGLIVYILAVYAGMWAFGLADHIVNAHRSALDAPRALALAFLVAAIPLTFGGVALVNARTRRDRRLTCPACGGALAECRRALLATGHCGHCGHRALAGPGG